MNHTRSNVFIALQISEDTRPIIEAIERDNSNAVVNHYPGMVKIDAPGRLVLRRQTVEDITGMDFDLQSCEIKFIYQCAHPPQTPQGQTKERKQKGTTPQKPNT